MKVKDLRKRLAKMPKDLDVVFSFPSGDEWNTPLADEITEDPEDIKVGKVLYSPPHGTLKVLDPESKGYNEHGKKVVILTGYYK